MWPLVSLLEIKELNHSCGCLHFHMSASSNQFKMYCGLFLLQCLQPRLLLFTSNFHIWSTVPTAVFIWIVFHSSLVTDCHVVLILSFLISFSNILIKIFQNEHETMKTQLQRHWLCAADNNTLRKAAIQPVLGPLQVIQKKPLTKNTCIILEGKQE